MHIFTPLSTFSSHTSTIPHPLSHTPPKEIITTQKPHKEKKKFNNMKLKATKTTFLLILLIITTISSLTGATRSDPNSKGSKAKGGGVGGGDFFGPSGGFGIPGFNDPGIFGGGYGYGYGSPSGGHSKSGTIRPSMVCKEKGPCYMKKLICPAKCFYSFSRSGKGYGGGGGGGGCTMDCKKKCIAFC